jgi:ABC-2 type transport system permease protein
MKGNWRRLWLVARREWNQRVRSRAFRIATLLSVLLVVALIAVPQMYGGGVEPTRTVGLVGTRSPQLPEFLDAAGDQLELGVETARLADEAAGRDALRSGDVAVLLVDQRKLVWKAEIDGELQALVTSTVGVLDRQEAIDDLGLTAEEAQRLQPRELPTSSLEPVTEERSAQIALASIGLVLLFMAIVFYCGFVMTGVVEEKASRVVEVLLSRLRPTELLAGKILGIGLVGLAQFTLVAVAAIAALRLSDNTLAPETTVSTIGWIVFWFVFGYGFYSVLYAAAGSLVSRQEDAESLQLPIIGILLVGYFFAFEAAENPDGVAALVGSLLPPTAPMVMITRLARGVVPWWQILLSVGLMVVTVLGIVQVAGRVYAGAVLRIGPRIGLREAWHGAEA